MYFDRELFRYGIDIAALQETRFSGTGEIKEQNYTCFWSGKAEVEWRKAGVAFAIRNTLVSKMLSLPSGKSAHLIVVRLPLEDGHFVPLISVYAPTMTYQE